MGRNVCLHKGITILREEKSYTQEQLAHAADIPLDTLIEIEAGTAQVNMGAIVSISKTLEVSPFELLAS
jgi:DNA-binding XRE family transcriptional regulator